VPPDGHVAPWALPTAAIIRAMQARETAARLESFEGRGAGTDAERRAAGWLAKELSDSRHEVVVETFWCRPSWALAHAWHVGLAVAGSLVSVASPIAGGSMLLVALVSLLADVITGVSPGRRLSPERASQNVIVVPSDATVRSTPRVRLILTANYDAGRGGLAYRDPIRGTSALLRHGVRGLTPGWLGWLSIALLWLIAVAIVRLEGHHSQAIGAVQLPPTVGLVLGFALLLELAMADWSLAAGDNGTGVAVAISVARALDATPPHHLDVELVLSGAGDRDEIGLHRYLRARRRERSAANTVVLGVAACGGGSPRWWCSDGALVPLRYTRTLRQLAADIAADEPHLGATPHKGRGTTPALPARNRRLPAITIGCLDSRGLAPRSHQQTDVAAAIDGASVDRAIQFGLLLIDAIDTTVAEGQGHASPAAA